MCPRTAMYVSSYYYVCVLILLYMCPHTATHVCSNRYIRVNGAAFDEPDVCAADADNATNGATLACAHGQNGAPLDRHG